MQKSLLLFLLLLSISFLPLQAQYKYQWQMGSQALGLPQLISPKGITVDAQGNIFVVDAVDILKFDSNGHFILRFGGPGTGDGQFYVPEGIAVDLQGFIYVVDSGNNRIQKFSSTGKFISKFGNYGTGDGQFIQPKGITVDTHGNIFVTDEFNSNIQKFNSSGQFLFKFGSYGTGDGQFKSPYDIEVDKQGNIYLNDNENYRIQKFNANGQFLLKFGSQGSSNGQFRNTTGLTIDSQGNIYVADSYNLIQKFNTYGQFLLKFSIPASSNGTISFPAGMSIDKQGIIFIADPNNHQILKYSPNGQFLTKFGSMGSDAGQFQAPWSVAIDRWENVYVADRNNYRIQKFSLGTQTLRKNYIEGRIYNDINKNCIYNTNEPGLNQLLVLAEPGPYYGLTDSLGNYSIAVDTGTYTIKQILPSNNLVQQICPNTLLYTAVFTAYDKAIIGKDFANQIIQKPYLTANVTSDRRRRCFTNNTTISFSNTGNTTANEVKVHLELPEYTVLVSADFPFTINSTNRYIFDIGNVPVGQNSTIQIVDSVVCDNPDIRDLTQCTKVWITPDNSRTPSPDWDKSDITLKATCADNGFVKLSIHNTGTGHMADSSSFRIYLDAISVFRHNFKLDAGDSLLLQVPANGQTVRVEADQRPYHPFKTQTNITIEACGKNGQGKVSTGFVAQLPQDDEESEVAIECLPIIYSFDPNDKLVLPAGVTENHYTPTNRVLDYTIRFQNTGSDYAYKVVVVDTLSEHLDMSTFQMVGASHNYRLSITGKGRPILTWTFDNINLPDSTRDQLGSNGFIKFSIKPLVSIAEKTVIENYADIFFDFNEPVRTNTVFNAIYDVPAPIINNEKVIICQTNTAAFAGTNRSLCEQDTVYLSALMPSFGKGKWKVVKGAAKTNVQDLNNPASLVTELSYGENIFEWKVPANACSTDSTTSTVYIYRKPAPDIPVISQKGEDSLFCSISGTSYEWYKEGVKFEGISQQIKVSESGNYTVKVSLEECLSSLSEVFSYQQVPTGLEEYGTQIKIYPNPATSSVFIELPVEWEAKLSLIDAMGRALKVSMATNQQKRELSLADIKAGIYILYIETAKGIFVKKLIVR